MSVGSTDPKVGTNAGECPPCPYRSASCKYHVNLGWGSSGCGGGGGEGGGATKKMQAMCKCTQALQSLPMFACFLLSLPHGTARTLGPCPMVQTFLANTQAQGRKTCKMYLTRGGVKPGTCTTALCRLRESARAHPPRLPGSATNRSASKACKEKHQSDQCFE